MYLFYLRSWIKIIPCVIFDQNYVMKQHTISKSTTEVEYRSLAQVTSYIVDLLSWANSYLKLYVIVPVQFPCLLVQFYMLDYYFVQEKVLQKLIDIQHVPTYDQLADGFTKAILSLRFNIVKGKLRVENFSTLSLRGY